MPALRCHSSSRARQAFSLVEIMIVVVLIGLLASMAIASYQNARIDSLSRRFANDFRTFRGAFETHALETGQWAADGGGNSLPAGVRPYLAGSGWFRDPPGGGYWDWEYDRLGVTAGIALAFGNDMPEVMQEVDDLLDDGDLSSGRFLKTGDRYLLVLEE